MRLISVQVILEIERGIINPGAKILHNFNDTKLRDTKYAILSHCWDEEDEEVMYKEMRCLAVMNEVDRAIIRQRSGYQKIVKTCEQALRDGFKWAWIDTCCIDKESSAELSEAINSMYRWYADAGMCYAYLHDVQGTIIDPSWRLIIANASPRWFSRGWTLQELIAPKEVSFFNRRWEFLGQKTHHAPTLSKITTIPEQILRYGLQSNRPCAAQIMSWAAWRKTTREEDRAYSLMGLFKVYMPMFYGEGKNVFRRLQLEILKTTNDHSIFAWDADYSYTSVLADDPDCFQHCNNVTRMEAEEYRETIKQIVPEDQFRSITEEQLRTCSVTNGGIQIWLPIRQIGDVPIFQATLACRNQRGPERIWLALCKSQYHRYPADVGDYGPTDFRQMFLAYNEEMGRDNATFKIEDSVLSQEGFIREGETDNTITLRTGGFHMVGYYNPYTSIRFEVFLGCFLGHPWAHVVFPCQRFDPQHVGPGQVEALRSATLGKIGNAYCLVKHLHLPDTVSGVQLTYQRRPQPNSHLLTLAVTPCTGHRCSSNNTWKPFDTIPVGETDIFSHARSISAKDTDCVLFIDNNPITFMSTLEGCECQLGDYGQWNHEGFKREGNIFIDFGNPNFHTIEHAVCDRWGDADRVTFHCGMRTLSLRHLQGWSIPDNILIRMFLRALSAHLKGKYLITTIVQCSECLEGDRVLPVSTPLCVLAQPLVWYEEGATKTGWGRAAKVGSAAIRRTLTGRVLHD